MKYIVNGLSFHNDQVYKEAKKEAETIDYIKANTDLNDLNKILKLYHKLLEKNSFQTIIGISFLNDLRDMIVKGGVIDLDKLPVIPVGFKEKQYFSKTYVDELQQNKEKKLLGVIEDLRTKNRNSRIINIFLIGIIVVMIVIAIYSKQFNSFYQEQDIIDRYSAWEEDLKLREKIVEEKEAGNQ